MHTLNHFMVFGQKHLDYLVSKFVTYYHDHRCHQSLDNLPPVNQLEPPEAATIRLKDVVCRQSLGGLLKHYERRAA